MFWATFRPESPSPRHLCSWSCRSGGEAGEARRIIKIDQRRQASSARIAADLDRSHDQGGDNQKSDQDRPQTDGVLTGRDILQGIIRHFKTPPWGGFGLTIRM